MDINLFGMIKLIMLARRQESLINGVWGSLKNDWRCETENQVEIKLYIL